jgi:hypothetical protein
VKQTIAFCIALSCAAVVSLSVAAGETSPRAKHHIRHAPHVISGPATPPPAEQASNRPIVPPFSWLAQLFPNVKPYPPGQGDTDGLSRNPEDCNKGCVDNSRR